jgi:ubiquinone/menaquinone biosynthesis C-methylase UbiE
MISEEILAYYERGGEAGRLFSIPDMQLERLRTQELLRRYLPPPPAVVVDVGGGPGVYACWLASLGYELHLVDPVPLHLEQAREASAKQPLASVVSFALADASKLSQADASADAILLMGPLYHVTNQADRITALSEAHRVLKPGGTVIAVGISRFASALDGLHKRFVEDAMFHELMLEDLRSGQHRNPTGQPGYFTSAFFHLPEDLVGELQAAGFTHERTVGIEGPAWLMNSLSDYLSSEDGRRLLLGILEHLESEQTLLGVSSHLMAIGRKHSS